VLGVLIAFVATAVRQVTGVSFWDAAAAVLIGALLCLVAVFLDQNAKDLLIGTPARADERERLVDEVVELLTMCTGPHSVLVRSASTSATTSTASRSSGSPTRSTASCERSCRTSPRFSWTRRRGTSEGLESPPAWNDSGMVASAGTDKGTRLPSHGNGSVRSSSGAAKASARTLLPLVGGAFTAGLVLAKIVDWRGHAHPRG